jgi:ribosomal-protein-serine acetyltransferase
MKETKTNTDFKLREIQLSDATDIFNIIDRDREYLREWLPFVDITKKTEDTEAFIRLVKSKGTEHDEVYVILSGEKIAGLISYKGKDKFNHKIEIGYWLAKNLQGNGFVTRSCILLINNAFEFMGMNRVQIKVGVKNKKSAAVPKRLNFTFEGIERDGEYLNGVYIDLEVYSVLKRDWNKTKTGYEAF